MAAGKVVGNGNDANLFFELSVIVQRMVVQNAFGDQVRQVPPHENRRTQLSVVDTESATLLNVVGIIAGKAGDKGVKRAVQLQIQE